MSFVSPFERNVAPTIVFVVAHFASVPALAAGSNMPWEQPLNQILQSVEGPVAKIIGYWTPI
jgi:type IV secretion system protein TrbC